MNHGLILTKRDTTVLAKRALFLAWRACGAPHGMGVLRDRPHATEDEVWSAAVKAHDYDGSRLKAARTEGAALRVDADYVFGRMLKLTLYVFPDRIEVLLMQREAEALGLFEPGYHAFVGDYATPRALFDAAEASLQADDAVRSN